MTELTIAYAPLRFTYHLLEDNVRASVDRHVRAAPDPLAVVAIHRRRSGAARAQQRVRAIDGSLAHN